ncbi:MAG: hypothetical protein EAZ27_05250 [Cytophagales bacterium]|nr:MAG: hypothetical protein EAZ27_05250 [Cytophagales bacterium]
MEYITDFQYDVRHQTDHYIFKRTSKNPNIILKNPTQTNLCYETEESKWEGFIGIEVFRSSLKFSLLY